MARVVVGVEGSGRSRAALVRALREAQLRDGKLEAVLVFDPDQQEFTERITRPLTTAWQPHGAAEIVETMGAREDPSTTHFREARDHAKRRLANALQDALGQEVTRVVKGVVIPGRDPAEVLVEYAEGADLLVIGVRQRSPVGKLILGSDARDIILQSTVPVLSVPASEA